MNIKNYLIALAGIGCSMILFTDVLSSLLSIREEHGFVIAGAILIGSSSIGLAMLLKK